MEVLTQIKEWLSELLYRTNDIEDHFKIREIDNKKEGYFVNFFTRTNQYQMIVTPSVEPRKIYFGCQVTTRKRRAGETWDRGNDLSDGQFNEETWLRIKNAIISYELVKISKIERGAIDEEIENLPS